MAKTWGQIKREQDQATKAAWKAAKSTPTGGVTHTECRSCKGSGFDRKTQAISAKGQRAKCSPCGGKGYTKKGGWW